MSIILCVHIFDSLPPAEMRSPVKWDLPTVSSESRDNIELHLWHKCHFVSPEF